MTAEPSVVWPSTAEVDAWAEAFTAPGRAEQLLRRLRRVVRRGRHARKPAAGKATAAQGASNEGSAA